MPGEIERQPPDPDHVEELVQAMGLALEKTSIPDSTNFSELASAIFTLLDRVLTGMEMMESNGEGQGINKAEIANALSDLLLKHGRVYTYH